MGTVWRVRVWGLGLASYALARAYARAYAQLTPPYASAENNWQQDTLRQTLRQAYATLRQHSGIADNKLSLRQALRQAYARTVEMPPRGWSDGQPGLLRTKPQNS